MLRDCPALMAQQKIIKMNKHLYEEVIKLRAAMGEAVPSISAFEDDSDAQEATALSGQDYEDSTSVSAYSSFIQCVPHSSPLPQMEVHNEISIPMTTMALAEQALPSTEYGTMPSFTAYPSLPADFAAPTKSYIDTDSASDPVSGSFPAHSSSLDLSALDFNTMPAFNNYNATLLFVLFFTVPLLYSEAASPVAQLTAAGTSRTLNWLNIADSTFTFTPTVLALGLAALCFTLVLVCWVLSLRGWHKQRGQQSSLNVPLRRRKTARNSFWSRITRFFRTNTAVDSPAPVVVKKIEI